VSLSIAAVLVVYAAAVTVKGGATLRGWSLLLWIPILVIALYGLFRIALVAVVVGERSKRRRALVRAKNAAELAGRGRRPTHPA
jgi:hypothetical protein